MEKKKNTGNSLTHNWFKFKEFADDKINVNENQQFLLELVESIEQKGENAGYQHFLLFPQCFLKDFLGSLKVGILW